MAAKADHRHAGHSRHTMPVQILPGFTPEVLPGEMGPAFCAAITAEQQRNRFHTEDACDHMNLLSAAAPSSIFILTAPKFMTHPNSCRSVITASFWLACVDKGARSGRCLCHLGYFDAQNVSRDVRDGRSTVPQQLLQQLQQPFLGSFRAQRFDSSVFTACPTAQPLVF